jgi:hypothetical protein
LKDKKDNDPTFAANWAIVSEWTPDSRYEIKDTRLAEIITKNRSELGGIDASDTEMVLDSHPAMKGLKNFIRAPGLGSIHFSGNRFNGFYLPDGIILRVDL